ncbi:hypothetical protein S7711_04067 [Stachybotrys chartarum IBT 7711]|uniref:Uncharacterized protein n=1 Tax=Stachybotrys chartarum (strain CBS 109288 / IBT 7711) TaxID=1280523 RepID=A0A084AR18_STACB|nr:hypothetical protein S7711_04067 [Stachybotrys chartarum IBT 7711]
MSLETILAAGAWLVCQANKTVAVISSMLIVLLATVAAYRLFFHPLSAVPGPRIAAISNIWHAVHARNGQMANLGRTLHRKYGPVVRVGPNEVWFNTPEAHKAIYSSGSGFEKSDFYLATSLSRPTVDWSLRLHFPDTLDLLSERDMKRYRMQRRLIGPVYQASNLAKYEPAVDAVLAQAIAKLKALDGAEVELKEYMHIIAVECLGAVVLSWSPGLLKQGTDWNSSTHAYQGWRRKSVLGLFPAVVKLEFCHKTVGRLFSQLWGVSFKTPDNFRPFFPDVGRRIVKRIALALRPNPPKDDRRDLVYDLVQLHRDKPQFTESYLKKMAMTNFGAGHETMASTLTSIVAMIASHPTVHTLAAHEIRSSPNPSAYSASSHLAYTQAAIREAKRLHPVLSMSLPRTVPAGGLSLHGHFIPAGTTVGCNPVALHRNEDVCGPQPDTYEPRRWLDGEAARRMERCSLAWGGGARSCPGRNLAELVVYKVIPAIFEEFDVEVKMPKEEQSKSYFLSMLVGVKARFLARTDGVRQGR